MHSLSAVEDLFRALPVMQPSVWATKAPRPWFCGMCDSQCSEGEIRVAKVQPRLWRRPLIVLAGIEWRHAAELAGGDWQTVHQIEKMLQDHLPPATAVRWDPQAQRIKTVAGRVVGR